MKSLDILSKNILSFFRQIKQRINAKAYNLLKLLYKPIFDHIDKQLGGGV